MFHFKYSLDDLSLSAYQASQMTGLCNGSAPESDNPTNAGVTDFDETLQKLWNDADRKHLFRYSFKVLPTKIVSEKFEFVVQLNPERATKRRVPQEIQHVNQPFNPDEFNFNKAKPEETIMTLSSSASTHDGNTALHQNQSSVIINVSPLEYCHVLLVPAPSQNQPQTITVAGLKSAVELLLLSRSCDFRVGFNSLCGFASVNHHHYHAYYLKHHRLYIEHAELKRLTGPCFEFSDSEYPAAGFVFVLQDLADMTRFVEDCFALISYLQENDVAHNVYITRGSSRNVKHHFDCVRLFVWGRVSSFGSKACHAFNPALCELAGHFPLKNEESYTTMTEDFIVNELRGICHSTFEKVKSQIGTLWKDGL